jgi:hypothetical protein
MQQQQPRALISITANHAGSGGPGEVAGLSTALDGPNSPRPTTKERCGLTGHGAMHFRRTLKTFLRTKVVSFHVNAVVKVTRRTGHDERSLCERNGIDLTVSLPQSARSTLGQPSLKLKKSTVSIGIPGSSSDASTNGDARATSDGDVFETVRVPHVHADEEKHHENNKKLKRGAEKMLSLLRRCDEITASTLSLVHASFTHILITQAVRNSTHTYRGIYSRLRSARTHGISIYISLTNARSFYSLWSSIFPFPLLLFPAVRSSSSLSRLDPIEPSPL